MDYRRILRIEQLSTLKRPEMALKELIHLMEEEPGSALLLRMKGELLIDLERYDEARQAVEEALNIDPNSESAHNLLGIVALKQKKLKKAESHFVKGLELNPDESALYGNLSRVYLARGKVKKVIEYAEKGLELDPKNEFCLNSLFWAYYTKGEQAKANRILKENLAQNPENVETLINHGHNLLLADRHAEAQEVFASVLEFNAESREAISGYKEAATGNHDFYRWVNSKRAERVARVIGYLLLISMMVLRRGFGFPLRLYWVYALLLGLIMSFMATNLGIGKLLAYKKNRLLRAQYGRGEMAMAIALPILLIINLVVISFCARELAGRGAFPIELFLLSIYLSMVQVGIGISVNQHNNTSSKDIVIIGIALHAAVASFFLDDYWWVGFISCIAVVVGYFLFNTRAFWQSRSLRKIWKDLNK